MRLPIRECIYLSAPSLLLCDNCSSLKTCQESDGSKVANMHWQNIHMLIKIIQMFLMLCNLFLQCLKSIPDQCIPKPGAARAITSPSPSSACSSSHCLVLSFGKRHCRRAVLVNVLVKERGPGFECSRMLVVPLCYASRSGSSCVSFGHPGC